MAYRKVFAMQKQWSVEVVSCINDWANSCWDDNEMNESMHRSLSERMYHDSTNQWISGTMSRRINESMNQWISESTNHWFNKSVSQWINESIKGSTVEWLNESMNQGLTRINESMKEWIDESLNHWTKEPMNQSILPTSSSKSALILFFFAILKCKSNSRYSLVHILPASSFKSAPIPSVFCEMQIELLLQSGAYSADLIFQKCSAAVSF
jgi:macrodomain Ter protein organizer (MatP/YcbG family)